MPLAASVFTPLLHHFPSRDNKPDGLKQGCPEQVICALGMTFQPTQDLARSQQNVGAFLLETPNAFLTRSKPLPDMSRSCAQHMISEAEDSKRTHVSAIYPAKNQLFLGSTEPCTHSFALKHTHTQQENACARDCSCAQHRQDTRGKRTSGIEKCTLRQPPAKKQA